VILCDLSQWKRIYAGFSYIFFYALPLEIQLSRGDGSEYSLTGLTPPHFVPISWYFSMFNELMREVIVRFVDNGGIVDHHCLDFLNKNHNPYMYTYQNSIP
jgi:hypothetical protein